MFICASCGRQTVPKELQFTEVLQKRERTYPKAKKIHNASCAKFRRLRARCDCDGPNIDTFGWEIAREMKVCEECKEKR